MKPADITEESLWKERQEQIDVKVTDDPFVPALEAEPTPEEDVLVKVIL